MDDIKVKKRQSVGQNLSFQDQLSKQTRMPKGKIDKAQEPIYLWKEVQQTLSKTPTVPVIEQTEARHDSQAASQTTKDYDYNMAAMGEEYETLRDTIKAMPDNNLFQQAIYFTIKLEAKATATLRDLNKPKRVKRGKLECKKARQLEAKENRSELDAK